MVLLAVNLMESALSLKCFSTSLNLPLPSNQSAPLYGDDGFRVPWTASQLSGLHCVVLFTQMRSRFVPLGQPLFEPPRQASVSYNTIICSALI